jgi:hypothetical protein
MLNKRFELMDKYQTKRGIVLRFKLGIILTMIRKAQNLHEHDINKNEMKVSNVAQAAAREDAEFRKLEALRHGVEHLQHLKDKMEAERKREEELLQIRIKEQQRIFGKPPSGKATGS